MKDPAAAAGMSDPVRNPSFRRRWREVDQLLQPVVPSPKPGADPLGPIGLALLDAWRRKQTDRQGVGP